MKLTKVKYVEMPISFEEKRALNAQGFKVVDAKYKPKEQKSEQAEQPKAEEAPAPKRGRKPKAED